MQNTSKSQQNPLPNHSSTQPPGANFTRLACLVRIAELWVFKDKRAKARALVPLPYGARLSFAQSNSLHRNRTLAAHPARVQANLLRHKHRIAN